METSPRSGCTSSRKAWTAWTIVATRRFGQDWHTGDECVGIGGELLAGVLGYLQRGTVRPRKQAADEVVQYFSMHPRIHAVAERKARRRVSQ
jgi:hypothetical protein